MFPHFQHVRQATGYANEQISLVIIETFKGQDNGEVTQNEKTKNLKFHHLRNIGY